MTGEHGGKCWWFVEEQSSLSACGDPVLFFCVVFLWPLLSIRALAHHFHAEACKAGVRKAFVPALGRGIWGTGAEGGSCLS